MKTAFDRLAWYVGILSLALLPLAGCGGGGGASGGAATGVGGTVSLGYFTTGTVKVYKGDGTTLITTTQIVPATLGVASQTGSTYSASLGSYTGPIIAKAFGTYYDEATQLTKVIDEAHAIHAALPNASGTVTLPITALTEIAYQQLPAAPTAVQIATANTLVSNTFHVDILAAKPADPSVPGALAAAGQAARDYALALATLSQLAQDAYGGDQSAAINAVAQDLAANANVSTTSANFQTALQTYIADTGAPQGTNLTAVGTKALTLTVTANSTPAVKIGGIDFTMTLPAGASVAADFTNKAVAPYPILASSLFLGNAVPVSGSFFFGSYSPAVTSPSPAPANIIVALASLSNTGSGFPAGEVIDVIVNVPVSYTFSASDFPLSSITVTSDGSDDPLHQGNPQPLPGVTLSVSSK